MKGLKGEVVVNKLKYDFNMSVLFKEIRSSLPLVTHDPVIELIVLKKEMMEAAVPDDTSWKEINRLGRQVLKIASTS